MSLDSKSRFQAKIKMSNEPTLRTCSSQGLSSQLRNSNTSTPFPSLTTQMATVIIPVHYSHRARTNTPLVKASPAIGQWQHNQLCPTGDQAVNFIAHIWKFFTSNKYWKKLANYLLFIWAKRTRKDFSTFLFSSSLVILGRFLWQLRHCKIAFS